MIIDIRQAPIQHGREALLARRAPRSTATIERPLPHALVARRTLEDAARYLDPVCVCVKIERFIFVLF